MKANRRLLISVLMVLLRNLSYNLSCAASVRIEHKLPGHLHRRTCAKHKYTHECSQKHHTFFHILILLF